MPEYSARVFTARSPSLSHCSSLKATRGQDAADLDLSAYFHPAKSPLLAPSVSRPAQFGPSAGSHALRSSLTANEPFARFPLAGPVASAVSKATWNLAFSSSNFLPLSPFLLVYLCVCSSIFPIYVYSSLPLTLFSFASCEHMHYILSSKKQKTTKKEVEKSTHTHGYV